MGIALNATLLSLAMTSLGATPAAAATTVSDTAWIPLDCNIGSQFGGPEQHLAVALQVTHAKHVQPGKPFTLSGISAVQVLPGLAQATAAGTFHANAIEGVVFDFEQHLTNANGNFTPGGNGNQINTVAAMQPPNGDAPPVGSATVSQTSPRDALIDPNTAHPSPLAAWTNNNSGPVPASDARRHNDFSFGPFPISSSPSAPNVYAPSPGTGGGSSVTSGTPDKFNVFPFTVTGAAGQNVVLDVGDASRTVSHSSGNPSGPLVTIAGTFYFSPSAGVWLTSDANSDPYPIYCNKDTSTAKVAKPDPTMVDTIQIPITCDNHDCTPYGSVAAVVRTLSVAGIDASQIGTLGAILVVFSTFIVVAVRRRRAGRL